MLRTGLLRERRVHSGFAGRPHLRLPPGLRGRRDGLRPGTLQSQDDGVLAAGGGRLRSRNSVGVLLKLGVVIPAST